MSATFSDYVLTRFEPHLYCLFNAPAEIFQYYDISGHNNHMGKQQSGEYIDVATNNIAKDWSDAQPRGVLTVQPNAGEPLEKCITSWAEREPYTYDGEHGVECNFKFTDSYCLELTKEYPTRWTGGFVISRTFVRQTNCPGCGIDSQETFITLGPVALVGVSHYSCPNEVEQFDGFSLNIAIPYWFGDEFAVNPYYNDIEAYHNVPEYSYYFAIGPGGYLLTYDPTSPTSPYWTGAGGAAPTDPNEYPSGDDNDFLFIMFDLQAINHYQYKLSIFTSASYEPNVTAVWEIHQISDDSEVASLMSAFETAYATTKPPGGIICRYSQAYYPDDKAIWIGGYNGNTGFWQVDKIKRDFADFYLNDVLYDDPYDDFYQEINDVWYNAWIRASRTNMIAKVDIMDWFEQSDNVAGTVDAAGWIGDGMVVNNETITLLRGFGDYPDNTGPRQNQWSSYLPFGYDKNGELGNATSFISQNVGFWNDDIQYEQCWLTINSEEDFTSEKCGEIIAAYKQHVYTAGTSSKAIRIHSPTYEANFDTGQGPAQALYALDKVFLLGHNPVFVDSVTGNGTTYCYVTISGPKGQNFRKDDWFEIAESPVSSINGIHYIVNVERFPNSGTHRIYFYASSAITTGTTTFSTLVFAKLPAIGGGWDSANSGDSTVTYTSGTATAGEPIIFTFDNDDYDYVSAIDYTNLLLLKHSKYYFEEDYQNSHFEIFGDDKRFYMFIAAKRPTLSGGQLLFFGELENLENTDKFTILVAQPESEGYQSKLLPILGKDRYQRWEIDSKGYLVFTHNLNTNQYRFYRKAYVGSSETEMPFYNDGGIHRIPTFHYPREN